MTLVDIIREKHFEDEEELIELVERKMRLFEDEPEKAESSRGISEGDVDEEADDTTPANEAEIADQALPGSEGKGMMLSAYILGMCSAWDELTILTSIYRAFIRCDCGIPDFCSLISMPRPHVLIVENEADSRVSKPRCDIDDYYYEF
jgi:hypothetical protein